MENVINYLTNMTKSQYEKFMKYGRDFWYSPNMGKWYVMPHSQGTCYVPIQGGKGIYTINREMKSAIIPNINQSGSCGCAMTSIIPLPPVKQKGGCGCQVGMGNKKTCQFGSGCRRK